MLKTLEQVGLAAFVGLSITFAHHSSAKGAWAFWEECNLGGDLDVTDLYCTTEEVREIYWNGSYDSECVEEGCSYEERKEHVEAPSGQKNQGNDAYLNHFCFLNNPLGALFGGPDFSWNNSNGNETPGRRGTVRSVLTGHFKGAPGNIWCF